MRASRPDIIIRPFFMTPEENRTTTRWRWLAYGSVLTSLVLVLVLGLWGAYRDVSQGRDTIVQSAAERLTAQARRRASHIESALQQRDGEWDLRQFAESDWAKLYWDAADSLQPGQIYAAVVAPGGEILMHTNPSFVGRSVGGRWYHHKADELGPDLYVIDAAVLDKSEAALDIAMPILVSGREVGVYHEGLSQAWIEQQIAVARKRTVTRWSIVITAIAIVLLAGMASLHYIARHSVALRRALQMADARRFAEIGQLAGGLAHEVRNPLHALRLNMHTLRRGLVGGGLPKEDLVKMTESSEVEIDRVDYLLRELLGYAQPEESRAEAIDVREEIEGTIEFLREDMRQAKIDIQSDLPAEPLRAVVDHNRLRQVLVNLLLNSRDALEQGGHVGVSAEAVRGKVEISVADNGAGVPENQRDRIFEPFVTSKPGGSGFGLALVKRYVQEANGEVDCVSNAPRGTKFIVRLPMAPR